MRIRGEITGMETTGDQLKMTIQGDEDGAAGWRPMDAIEVRVADISAKRRRAFRVGRRVVVDLRVDGKP